MAVPAAGGASPSALLTALQDDWACQADRQPSCLMYDSSRRRLVTAWHRPYVWQHKVRLHASWVFLPLLAPLLCEPCCCRSHCEPWPGTAHAARLQAITQDRTGHREPVRGALYNATFGVIVSVDEGGTVCVWNLQVRTQR